ncbi:MAG TPA: DUF294 nucleotidyltransferase-like domain-containing protein [Burkholderiales bacterium]
MVPALPPSNLTALVALPALAFDLETTGLDVQHDRVVQVGALALSGARLLDAPRIDQLIDPGMPMPATARRIHGLDDAAVRGAPRFADFVSVLQGLMSGRVLIGHHIGFDLAILRHEAARAGVAWRDPPSLDLALLVGALEPGMTDPTLEAVAARLNVVVHGRHSALGDATTAAGIFAALLPRLREAGLSTLGEARALAARREDLVQRQAASGWHRVPDGAPDMPPARPARLDTYVFERRISEIMSSPAAMVPADASLLEAARQMSERRIGALLVGSPDAAPLGILTERDVLRATATGDAQPGSTRVSEIMSRPVQTMGAEEMLYRALGRMDRMGIRHLCVVDPAGRALGMVSQRDLLRHRARAAFALGDAIDVAQDVTGLAAAFGGVPQVAAALAAEGVGGPDVAQVVSNELRAATARAAALALQGMREKYGDAPAPWSLLVLGSGGRGESLLSADQDNALVHAGTPDDDPWFAAFGEAVADILDASGVPRCQGGVMAANAPWRGTREDWSTRIGGWLRRARREDLLSVDIFFDLRSVAGDAGIAQSLHQNAVTAASNAPAFLALLAESITAMAPSLGLFGRLRTENGRIDVKRCGLLPLVGLSRTLALRVGSMAASTPDRLRDAAAADRISPADAGLLIRIHADLMGLVLQQQLADLEAGVRPSSRVETARLGRQGARRLARQLGRLEEIVQALRAAVSR